jgi:single-strand DNA-binding protein
MIRPRGVDQPLQTWSLQLNDRATRSGTHIKARKENTMAQNINRVTVTGNLTAEPQLNHLPSGTAVCDLRVAVNGRRKDNESGQWVDKPNYFNVKVWGAQGENAAKFLAKGRPVAIDGRLDWREWTDKEGNKRQAIDIIADTVQFLGSRDGAPSNGNGGGFAPPANTGYSGGVDQSDYQPVGAAPSSAPSEDDIPF